MYPSPADRKTSLITSPSADPSSITRLACHQAKHTHIPAPNRMQPRRLNHDLGRLGTTTLPTDAAPFQPRLFNISRFIVETMLGALGTCRRRLYMACFWRWPFRVAYRIGLAAWKVGGRRSGCWIGCWLGIVCYSKVGREIVADGFGLGNGGVKTQEDGREFLRRHPPFIV
jgi:hypothetical protein